jgi:hypothetical protein
MTQALISSAVRASMSWAQGCSLGRSHCRRTRVSRWEGVGSEKDSGRSEKTIRDRGKILLMLFALRFMFAIIVCQTNAFLQYCSYQSACRLLRQMDVSSSHLNYGLKCLCTIGFNRLCADAQLLPVRAYSCIQVSLQLTRVTALTSASCPFGVPRDISSQDYHRIGVRFPPYFFS